MTPELKLKMAAEEIKDVLRKYDIAGAIGLHTPGHGEYFVHITTSYSCAYIYNDDEVRFYSKSEDYKSRKEQSLKQALTANMLNILMDMSAFCFGFLEPISSEFDSLVDAKHEKT